jgi:hypothetical protein
MCTGGGHHTHKEAVMSNKYSKLIEFSGPDFIRIGDQFINIRIIDVIVFGDKDCSIFSQNDNNPWTGNYPEGKDKEQMIEEFKLYCVRYRDEQTNC